MVTIDRYVAVCRPFQTHLRNLRQVKLYVIGVMLGAIAYNIPQFFEREVSHHDPCTKQATVTKTAFGQNKLYYVLYKVCCYMIFRSIGPLVTLLVLELGTGADAEKDEHPDPQQRLIDRGQVDQAPREHHPHADRCCQRLHRMPASRRGPADSHQSRHVHPEPGARSRLLPLRQRHH